MDEFESCACAEGRPVKSWVTGESIMGALNWALGNMFMSLGPIMRESSSGNDMLG